MSQKVKEFPDVVNKLAAPSKKSLFERQKAEAEAKRQKEQEETAAVYEDFVKSFDDDAGDSGPPLGTGRGGGPSPVGGPGGFSKRHFSAAPSGTPGRGRGIRGRSGPGSLGPPPPSLSRKRPFDEAPGGPRDSKHGMFAFEDLPPPPTDARTKFQTSDDEDDQDSQNRAQERAAPKPTLHLSSLPPGTSPAVVKSIVPSSLNIDAVRILPPPPTGTADRRSFSAIITLAQDTPAGDLDTVVSALQNKYLGWGFYLSISRHLSSAVASTSLLPSGHGMSSTQLPFGAKPITAIPGSLSRAPPPPHRGGFAPPSSYGPSGNMAGPGAFNRTSASGLPLQVPVSPPTELKQLKLIHKTVEALVEHGPEFEALLMSRPEVQRDERWAWIWDPRSAGGVWYRWRIWDIMTGAQARIKAGRGRNADIAQNIFSGGVPWSAPQERSLPFEYTTSLDEFVSDEDYDSSEDDEDDGDEGRRRLAHLQGGAPLPADAGGAGVGTESDLPSYLNPLQKAKLFHLLSRLPSAPARLRRGDVARVTAFAITHAASGADEVVAMLVANVHSPFSGLIPSSGLVEDEGANFQNGPLELAQDKDNLQTNGNDPDDQEQQGQNSSNNTDQKDKDKEKPDPSPSVLVSLYLLSDLLSTSSTSGIRHAWRYRSLIESALRSAHTFAFLGRLEKELGWGRLRAEKWRRSVSSLLALWEGWCVFPIKAHEGFVSEFVDPPLSAAEEQEERRKEKEKEEAAAAAAAASAAAKKATERQQGEDGGGNEDERDGATHATGRWKAVGPNEGADDGSIEGNMPDADEDFDGEAMIDDEDDENLDGEPMEEDDSDDAQAQEASKPRSPEPASNPQQSAQESKTTTPVPRRRPRAQDMFEDSD